MFGGGGGAGAHEARESPAAAVKRSARPIGEEWRTEGPARGRMKVLTRFGEGAAGRLQGAGNDSGRPGSSSSKVVLARSKG